MSNVNMWHKGKGRVVSANRPGPEWKACVNLSRIRNGKYQPYKIGSEEWRKDANAQMKMMAAIDSEFLK